MNMLENRLLESPNIGQEVKQELGRNLGWNGEQEGKTDENGTWELRSREFCEGMVTGHVIRWLLYLAFFYFGKST